MDDRFDEQVELHHKWLLQHRGGCRLDLSGKDLTGANFRGANLEYAIFIRAHLKSADFGSANLTRAIFYQADLEDASFAQANLSCADLSAAHFKNATFFRTDLRFSSFVDADLSGAHLSRAILEQADLLRAKLDGARLPYYKICPEEGDFIGWKRVANGTILKLLITGKRTSSLVGRKCRCSEAKVLEALGTKKKTFRSIHDRSFIYEVGAIVSEPLYNDDIRVECAPGIHFFMSKVEAEEF
jgi:hypothetical protein